MKNFCFTIDDNIRFLKEICKRGYDSLFQHPYLAMLHRLHKQFNLKIQLNLFNRTEDFDLSMIPDRYADEWKSNADWLKLSFHSDRENARPYQNSDYGEVYKDCQTVHNEILRFASKASLAETTTVHYCQTTEAGVMALKYSGIIGLLGLFGTADRPGTSYSLDMETAEKIRNGATVVKNGIAFAAIDMVINNFKYEDILPHLNGLLSRDTVRVMIHEQYFYPDYKSYQPDFEDKLTLVFETLGKNGFISKFFEDTLYFKNKRVLPFYWDKKEGYGATETHNAPQITNTDTAPLKPFEKAVFIKPAQPFDRGYNETNYAPIYAVDFTVTEEIKTAELRFCALGIGYAYINGKRVSADMFSPPWSNFDKTLWYMSYDVKDAVNHGENAKNRLAILCGNGFMNEDIPNTWNSTESPFRDHPKLICELIINGKTVLSTGSSWRYTLNTPYLMNRYRTGSAYDMRIPMPVSPETDISKWETAKTDDRAPKGVFRLCDCEPIRECEEITPVNVVKKGENTYLFDFGVNISGYARITTSQTKGDVLTLRYAEDTKEDGTLDSCDMEKFYRGNPTHVETVVTSGELSTFSTVLSYYGFRFLLIENLDFDTLDDLRAIFVHQDVERRSSFNCSDSLLNKLFDRGIRSTYSNLFYMPTDCPTREKYGWMNDAQSSAEQILTDFKAEKVLARWNTDICDAIDDEKGLPGIVPTFGWGYHWGNGPVSDGSLFEQAYRIYLHSGDASVLIRNLPYFRRYFTYLRTREDENGFLNFGLPDWANPQENEGGTPRGFINAVLRVRFARIASLAAALANEDGADFKKEEEEQTALVMNTFITEDGRCSVDEQTAVALLVYHRIYRNVEPLAAQLKELVERFDFHHNCGMLGLRHLYMALNKCGLQEYGYRILTAEGFPSYSEWIERGATTLWERWTCRESKNHHMYSDFMSWLIKTAGGIGPDENSPCFDGIEVAPYFFDKLSFVRAHYDTTKGRVETEWNRTQNGVSLRITAPTDGFVTYNGNLLPKGDSIFSIALS